MIALATFGFNPDLKQFYDLQREKLGVDQYAIDLLVHENEFNFFLALSVQAVEIGVFYVALVAALTSTRRLSFALTSLVVVSQSLWLFAACLAVATARKTGATIDALAVLEQHAKLAAVPLLNALVPFGYLVATTSDIEHGEERSDVQQAKKKTQ